jgi:hypothetical protein
VFNSHSIDAIQSWYHQPRVLFFWQAFELGVGQSGRSTGPASEPALLPCESCSDERLAPGKIVVQGSLFVVFVVSRSVSQGSHVVQSFVRPGNV